MTLVTQSAKKFCQEASNDAITSTPCGNNRSSIILRSSINKSIEFNDVSSAKKYLTPNRSYDFRKSLSSVVKEYSEIIKLNSSHGSTRTPRSITPNSASVQKRKLFSKSSAIPVATAKKIKISNKSSNIENKNPKKKTSISYNEIKSIGILNNIDLSKSLNKEDTENNQKVSDDCDKNKVDECKVSKEISRNGTDVTDSSNRMSGSSFNTQLSSKPSFIKRKLYSNVCDFTEHEPAKVFERSFLKKNSIINIYDQQQRKTSITKDTSVDSDKPTKNITRSSITNNDKTNNVKKVYPLRKKLDKNPSDENMINKTINFKTIPKESTSNYVAHLLKNDVEKNATNENVAKINEDDLDESEKMFDFNDTAIPQVKTINSSKNSKIPNKMDEKPKKVLPEKRAYRKRMSKSDSTLSKSKETVKKDNVKNEKNVKTKKSTAEKSKPAAKASKNLKKNNESEENNKKPVKTNKLPAKRAKNKVDEPKETKKSEVSSKSLKSKGKVASEESFTEENVKKHGNSFDDDDDEGEQWQNKPLLKYNQRNISFFDSDPLDNGKIYCAREPRDVFKQTSDSRGQKHVYDDVLEDNLNLQYLPYTNNRWDDERSTVDRVSSNCSDRRVVSSSFFKNGGPKPMDDSRICKVSIFDKSYRDVTQMLNKRLCEKARMEKYLKHAVPNNDTFKIPIGYPQRQNCDKKIVHSRRIDMHTQRNHNEHFDRRRTGFSENNLNDDFERRYDIYSENNENDRFQGRRNTYLGNNRNNDFHGRYNSYPVNRGTTERYMDDRSIDTYRGYDRNYDTRSCDVPFLNSTNRSLQFDNRILNNRYLQNDLQFSNNRIQSYRMMTRDQPSMALEGNYDNFDNTNSKVSRCNADNVHDYPIMEKYRRLHNYSTENRERNFVTYKKIVTVNSAGIDGASKMKVAMQERNMIALDESIPDMPQSIDDDMILINANKYRQPNDRRFADYRDVSNVISTNIASKPIRFNDDEDFNRFDRPTSSKFDDERIVLQKQKQYESSRMNVLARGRNVTDIEEPTLLSHDDDMTSINTNKYNRQNDYRLAKNNNVASKPIRFNEDEDFNRIDRPTNSQFDDERISLQKQKQYESSRMNGLAREKELTHDDDMISINTNKYNLQNEYRSAKNQNVSNLTSNNVASKPIHSNANEMFHGFKKPTDDECSVSSYKPKQYESFRTNVDELTTLPFDDDMIATNTNKHNRQNVNRFVDLTSNSVASKPILSNANEMFHGFKRPMDDEYSVSFYKHKQSESSRMNAVARERNAMDVDEPIRESFNDDTISTNTNKNNFRFGKCQNVSSLLSNTIASKPMSGKFDDECSVSSYKPKQFESPSENVILPSPDAERLPSADAVNNIESASDDDSWIMYKKSEANLSPWRTKY